MSRFDDPQGSFSVRYLATTLRGCLVETMSRFRPAPEVETLLADVGGIEEGDEDPTRGVGLSEWLAGQQVGHCTLLGAKPTIIDVDAPESLVALDKHPVVRNALDRSRLGSAANPARLDSGVVKLAGPIGRPITQAVSRAVFEWYDDVDGLRYASRLDGSETCWALYDKVQVAFRVEALSSEVVEHRDAVRSVAALYEIELPDPWI
ncbi:RES family NAD+ phosphorylase [Nocardioides sp. Kera G14]|uniref:RES family NAD+ phosphorylase n=1 Tax=Nocardioides sp. Kera G14 TaxID=2884264 RepID=UPI0039EE5081